MGDEIYVLVRTTYDMGRFTVSTRAAFEDEGTARSVYSRSLDESMRRSPKTTVELHRVRVVDRPHARTGRHYKFYGPILRQLRQERHLSSAEAARRAGVDEGRWLKWEQETESPQGIDELHAMSHALDMGVGEVWSCLFMDLGVLEGVCSR